MKAVLGSSLWVACAVVGLAMPVTILAGCMRPSIATPQLLKEIGTKRYKNRSEDEVHAAVVTALKLQGYELVTERPRIRTAPKLVGVSTTAWGSANAASAKSFSESVAWDILVEEKGSGVVVVAKHRASVNGMAMDQVFESWAKTNYQQLFEAIDSSLADSGAGAKKSKGKESGADSD